MVKNQLLSKIRKLHKRYHLPFQVKLRPAITWQQIQLEGYSKPLKTC